MGMGVIIIPDYGPTFLERGEYFSEQLDELKRAWNESEVDDSDYALSENWSDNVDGWTPRDVGF
jgi:hypothetical protein